MLKCITELQCICGGTAEPFSSRASEDGARAWGCSRDDPEPVPRTVFQSLLLHPFGPPSAGAVQKGAAVWQPRWGWCCRCQALRADVG